MINYKAIGLKEKELNDYGYQCLMDDIDKLEKGKYEEVYGDLNKEIDLTDIKNGYVYTPLLPFLENLTIDRELSVMFYLEGYNFYDEIRPFLENYTYIEDINVVNTYNYETHLERVIQYTVFRLKNDFYVSLEVHNGHSDIRCGYSPLYIFKYEGDIDYFEDIIESYTLNINNLVFDIRFNEVYDIDGNNIIDEYSFLEKIGKVMERTPLKVKAYTFEV